jgi:Ca2+-transporting ATPase
MRFRSIRRLSCDKVMWLSDDVLIAMLFVILYSPLSDLLKLKPRRLTQLFVRLGISAASVLWFELVKLVKKIKCCKQAA